VSAADPVRAIADAVLYEGYVLWPYRRSALKNQKRWTFGGVYPPAHSRRHPDDRAAIRAQVLVRGEEDAEVAVGVRFLQVVSRQVMRRTDAGPEPVDELTVAGERHLSWEEAVEREVELPPTRLGALIGSSVSAPVAIDAGESREPLRAGEAGPEEGAVVRRWAALGGRVELGAEPVGPGLHRLTVTVSNSTPWDGDEREDALRRAFCSTHAVLRARHGEFVSLTDPPADLAAVADGCDNDGVWPVLVGEVGDRSTILVSPIILEDHPRIAPESPGDLFDGGEIDQMLVLNILALTDEEKAEMRDSDPRAREILERTEALDEEELMSLHGAVREFGMARRP
jgi:hypothetical protein